MKSAIQVALVSDRQKHYYGHHGANMALKRQIHSAARLRHCDLQNQNQSFQHLGSDKMAAGMGQLRAASNAQDDLTLIIKSDNDQLFAGQRRRRVDDRCAEFRSWLHI